jgi:hypothetical protein
MRAMGVIGGVAATAMAVLGSLGAPPSAHATTFGIELNGTYRVSSNGAWARTNDVLMDEKSVVQTWTVTSSCVSPIECTGEVRSDQGWTGTLRLDDFWYVDHEVPNWVPCPDGTFADGHQMFMLWGVDPVTEGRLRTDLTTIAGRDITKSASGACGRNQPTVIELPVYMTKLS